MARSYRDLLVWQKAKTLAVRLYREAESFPKTETYGSQFSTATSICLRRFQHRGRARQAHTRGILALLEVDAQMAIALELGYVREETFTEIDREIYQVLGLLNRLIESLRTRPITNLETLKP